MKTLPAWAQTGPGRLDACPAGAAPIASTTLSSRDVPTLGRWGGTWWLPSHFCSSPTLLTSTHRDLSHGTRPHPGLNSQVQVRGRRGLCHPRVPRLHSRVAPHLRGNPSVPSGLEGPCLEGRVSLPQRRRDQRCPGDTGLSLVAWGTVFFTCVPLWGASPVCAFCKPSSGI